MPPPPPPPPARSLALLVAVFSAIVGGAAGHRPSTVHRKVQAPLSVAEGPRRGADASGTSVLAEALQDEGCSGPALEISAGSDGRLRYRLPAAAAWQASAAHAYHLSLDEGCRERWSSAELALLFDQQDPRGGTAASVTFGEPPPRGLSYLCRDGARSCLAKVDLQLRFRPLHLLPLSVQQRMPADIRSALAFSNEWAENLILEAFQWILLLSLIFFALSCLQTIWVFFQLRTPSERPALSALRLPTQLDRVQDAGLKTLTFGTGIVTLTNFSLTVVYADTSDGMVDVILCLAWLVGLFGIVRILTSGCRAQICDAAIARGLCIEVVGFMPLLDALLIAGFVVLCGIIGFATLGSGANPTVLTGALSGFLGAAKTIFGLYQDHRDRAESVCSISFAELADAARGLASEDKVNVVQHLAGMPGGKVSVKKFCFGDDDAPNGKGQRQTDEDRGFGALEWLDPYWSARVVNTKVGGKIGILVVPVGFAMLANFLVSMWFVVCNFHLLRPQLSSVDISSGALVPAFRPSVWDYSYVHDAGETSVTFLSSVDKALVPHMLYNFSSAEVNVSDATALTRFADGRREVGDLPMLSAKLLGGAGRDTTYSTSFLAVLHVPLTLTLSSGSWSRCVLLGSRRSLRVPAPPSAERFTLELRLASFAWSAPLTLEEFQAREVDSGVTTVLVPAVPGGRCLARCEIEDRCIESVSFGDGCLLAMRPRGSCQELANMTLAKDRGSPLDALDHRRSVFAGLELHRPNGTRQRLGQQFLDGSAVRFREVHKDPLRRRNLNTTHFVVTFGSRDHRTQQAQDLAELQLEVTDGLLPPDFLFKVPPEIPAEFFRKSATTFGVVLQHYNMSVCNNQTFFNIFVRPRAGAGGFGGRFVPLASDGALDGPCGSAAMHPWPAGDWTMATIRVDKLSPIGVHVIGHMVPTEDMLDGGLGNVSITVSVSTSDGRLPTAWSIERYCFIDFGHLRPMAAMGLMDEDAFATVFRHCEFVSTTWTQPLTLQHLVYRCARLHPKAMRRLLPLLPKNPAFERLGWSGCGLQEDTLQADFGWTVERSERATTTFIDWLGDQYTSDGYWEPQPGPLDWNELVSLPVASLAFRDLVCPFICHSFHLRSAMFERWAPEEFGPLARGCLDEAGWKMLARSALMWGHVDDWAGLLAARKDLVLRHAVWNWPIELGIREAAEAVEVVAKVLGEWAASTGQRLGSCHINVRLQMRPLARSVAGWITWVRHLPSACEDVDGSEALWTLEADPEPRVTDIVSLAELVNGRTDLGDGQYQEVDDDDADLLFTVPRLQVLRLPMPVKMTNEGVTKLANLTSLRRLELWAKAADDSAAEAFARLPHLEELALKGWRQLTDRGGRALAALPLKSLDLSGSQIGDDTVAALAKVQTLQELSLEGCRQVTDAGGAALGKLPRLRAADLSGMQVGDATAAALAGIPTLQNLTMRGCRGLSDKGGVAFGASSSLTTLDLSATQAGDGTLAALGRSPALQELHCAKCRRLSDKGAVALAASGSLRVLDLASTNVGNTAATALGAMPQLRDLSLASCRKLSDGVVPELARAAALRRLDLAGAALGGAALAALAAAPALEELSLQGAKFIDTSVSVLKSSRSLRTLDLSKTAVLFADIGFLAAESLVEDLKLQHCKQVADASHSIRFGKWASLRFLDLSYTPVTSAIFKELQDLPALEWLSVRGCRGVTDTHMLAYSRHLRVVDLTKNVVRPEVIKTRSIERVYLDTLGGFVR